MSSSSPSPWVWWLLGLLIAAAAVALVVVAVRGRRARRVWEMRLAGAVAESRWLAYDLAPNALGARSAAARRDLWTSRPRVDALERELSALVASAPKDRSDRPDRLRDAVVDLRTAMYATAEAEDREVLGAARQAQRQLDEALRALQPPPTPGVV